MGSSQFTTAVRFRLGLPPVNDTPPVCQCGQDMTNDHLVGCTMLRKGPLCTRHDKIVQCISSCAKRMGAVTTVEPRGSSGGIPDIQITHARGTHFVEVSVVHPQAPSNRSAAMRGAGVPIEYRENAKFRKYEKYVRDNGPARFTAVVFDSYGASGSGVKDLERLLSGLGEDESDGRHTHSSPQVIRDFKESVAISIQRSNAIALLRGCTSSRAALGSTRRRAGTAHPVASRMVRNSLNRRGRSFGQVSSGPSSSNNGDVSSRQQSTAPRSASHVVSSAVLPPVVSESAQGRGSASQSPRSDTSWSLSPPPTPAFGGRLPPDSMDLHYMLSQDPEADTQPDSQATQILDPEFRLNPKDALEALLDAETALQCLQ